MEKWPESVRDIRASGTTWCWWFLLSFSVFCFSLKAVWRFQYPNSFLPISVRWKFQNRNDLKSGLQHRSKWIRDQAETLLHSLERAAASIGLYVNAHKTEYMCYNQTGDISTLKGTPLKLVDKFTYLGSSVESTEKEIETRLTKAWTAINRLSIIWKSDLTDKMKRSFFQAAVTSILLYGCTTWTLTKRLEKKLDGNYTRMLRAILNKSWQQHPTRHQLYGHLPPITKTIQVRRTRHAGHCWRSRDELIRDVLLWIPTHGRAKAGRPARTYIQQLCEDTGCCPEDLPRAMNDRGEWRERVRDIRATSAIWWWWWVNDITVVILQGLI